MYPGHWGKVSRDKIAVPLHTGGDRVTHGDRSNRLAQLFWGAGLLQGSHGAGHEGSSVLVKDRRRMVCFSTR
jgi:hypothetical protein